MAESNPVGRPLKYKTPEEMQEIIDKFFEVGGGAWIGDGDEMQYCPTVSGLSLELGMSTEAFRNYESKDEFLATVKEAKQKIEKALEQRLFGQAVTGSIFNLKNNFGWKDKSETEHSGSLNTGELTEEQIDSRIAALLEKAND